MTQSGVRSGFIGGGGVDAVQVGDSIRGSYLDFKWGACMHMHVCVEREEGGREGGHSIISAVYME